MCVAKTKALISFAVSNREADLRLCFRICKKPVFSRRGSYDIRNTKGTDQTSKMLRLINAYVVCTGSNQTRFI